MSNLFSFTPGAQDTYEVERKTFSYFTGIMISALIFGVTQACINLTTLCYISVYLQNKGAQPGTVQVWGYFKYYFWRVFGASILLAILAGIGAVFCIIPGIYLGIVFSLVSPIIVMENASFGYAFNKSFTLIRNNWWFMFGVIIVMVLILWVANSIVTIPLALTPALGQLVSNRSITVPVVIFCSILRSLLAVTCAIPVIAISLCYFDLIEQKDGTGLLSRIHAFGMPEEPEQETPGNEPAEEY
jgi:hypothetical protein